MQWSGIKWETNIAICEPQALRIARVSFRVVKKT